MIPYAKKFAFQHYVQGETVKNLNRQPHNGKSERITVLLPPDLYQRIRREADRRLLSRSAVIREALALRFRDGDQERAQ